MTERQISPSANSRRLVLCCLTSPSSILLSHAPTLEPSGRRKQNAPDKRFCASASKLSRSEVEDLASTKRYQLPIRLNDGPLRRCEQTFLPWLCYIRWSKRAPSSSHY